MNRDFRLKEADLEETFARSSGPGGQHVNKVSTAVTLRHRPSVVSVTVQDSFASDESSNRPTAIGQRDRTGACERPCRKTGFARKGAPTKITASGQIKKTNPRIETKTG